MCYGWLISKGGQVIARGHGGFARGQATNYNIAEYLALIEGMDALLDMGIREELVMVIGDAKSVIDPMQHISGASFQGVFAVRWMLK